MSKDEKILHEMYRRSYKESTPSADWDELIANVEVDKNGVKIIDFMAYECELKVMEQIFEDVLKEYKIPKRRHQQFGMYFWLGCSPKTK